MTESATKLGIPPRLGDCRVELSGRTALEEFTRHSDAQSPRQTDFAHLTQPLRRAHSQGTCLKLDRESSTRSLQKRREGDQVAERGYPNFPRASEVSSLLSDEHEVFMRVFEG